LFIVIYMELVNERMKEHSLQIENSIMTKQKNDENNLRMKENIDKIKIELEDYNLIQNINNVCNSYKGNHQQQDLYKKLSKKKCPPGQKLNERTDVCKSDYELLLSKVVVDMYEEIQNLKAQK